jgi:hypothetical protein
MILFFGQTALQAQNETGEFGYAIGFKGLVNYISERLPVNEEIGKTLRKDIYLFGHSLM